MKTQEFLQYIEDYYPIEYDLLGEDNTIEIINTLVSGKDLEIVTSEEGSNFDISGVIELIAIIVQTIKTVLEIIDYLKEKQEKITFEKVKKKIQEKMNQSDLDQIDNEDLDEIIKEIIENRKK